MPLTLNQAIDIKREKAESTAVLEIYDFYVSKRGGFIQCWISAVVGSDTFDIEGIWVIKNVQEAYDVEIAGKTFTVQPGSYFTDAAQRQPQEPTTYDTIKKGLYLALEAMYGLSGTIS